MSFQISAITFMVQSSAELSGIHLIVEAQVLKDRQACTNWMQMPLVPHPATDARLPLGWRLAETLAPVQNARRVGLEAARHATQWLSWTKAVYEEQRQWAMIRCVPEALAMQGADWIAQAVGAALEGPAVEPWPPGLVPLNDWIKAGGLARE